MSDPTSRNPADAAADLASIARKMLETLREAGTQPTADTVTLALESQKALERARSLESKGFPAPKFG